MASYYSDIMDEVLGRNHRHRSLRTIFDPYSHEWSETTMDEKVKILQKIVDSERISLSSLILDIKVYYTQELANKSYAVDSVDYAFAEILEHVLAKQTVKSEKPIEKTENDFEKSEIIFEVGGEGGSICIIRKKSNTREKFIYKHDEFDPNDEGLDVNKRFEYDSFEEPFEMLNKTYPWHILYLMHVHSDYKKYISSKLVEKLNNEMVSEDFFNLNKGDFEKIFGIELICTKDDKKMPVWSYKKF